MYRENARSSACLYRRLCCTNCGVCGQCTMMGLTSRSCGQLVVYAFLLILKAGEMAVPLDAEYDADVHLNVGNISV